MAPSPRTLLVGAAIALAAAALTAAGSLKETPMTPDWSEKDLTRYVCHRADGPIMSTAGWTRRPGAALPARPVSWT